MRISDKPSPSRSYTSKNWACSLAGNPRSLPPGNATRSNATGPWRADTVISVALIARGTYMPSSCDWSAHSTSSFARSTCRLPCRSFTRWTTVATTDRAGWPASWEKLDW